MATARGQWLQGRGGVKHTCDFLSQKDIFIGKINVDSAGRGVTPLPHFEACGGRTLLLTHRMVENRLSALCF